MVVSEYAIEPFPPPLPLPKSMPVYLVFIAGLTGIAALGGAAFLLYYLKKRWDSRGGRRGSGETGVDLRSPEVEMSIIDNLRMACYPPEQRAGLELDPTCLICLEDMREGENVTVLPCHHFFHPHCIADELRYRVRCPKCYRALV